MVMTTRSAANSPAPSRPAASTPTPTKANGRTPIKGKQGSDMSDMSEEFWRKVFHVLPGLVTYGLWKTGYNPHHVAVVIFLLSIVCAGGHRLIIRTLLGRPSPPAFPNGCPRGGGGFVLTSHRPNRSGTRVVGQT